MLKFRSTSFSKILLGDVYCPMFFLGKSFRSSQSSLYRDLWAGASLSWSIYTGCHHSFPCPGFLSRMAGRDCFCGCLSALLVRRLVAERATSWRLVFYVLFCFFFVVTVCSALDIAVCILFLNLMSSETLL